MTRALEAGRFKVMSRDTYTPRLSRKAVDSLLAPIDLVADKSSKQAD